MPSDHMQDLSGRNEDTKENIDESAAKSETTVAGSNARATGGTAAETTCLEECHPTTSEASN